MVSSVASQQDGSFHSVWSLCALSVFSPYGVAESMRLCSMYSAVTRDFSSYKDSWSESLFYLRLTQQLIFDNKY